MRLNDLIRSEMFERENYLFGRIYTILDASISDSEQRKGLKDLVRQIREDINWNMRTVNRVIGQFGEKFYKGDFPEDERCYLKTGEWPKQEGEPNLPPTQNYFPEE